jgi:hypothetical protein
MPRVTALVALATVLSSADAACTDTTGVTTGNIVAGTTSACTIGAASGGTISAQAATVSCGVQCATGYTSSALASGTTQGTVTCSQTAFDNSGAMTSTLGTCVGETVGISYCIAHGASVLSCMLSAARLPADLAPTSKCSQCVPRLPD